jgi:hypothetical protein
VLAIAEHKHLPEVAATALAQYLLSHEHGGEKVRDMIVDDFRRAQLSGDKEAWLTLLHVLHHFLKTHPEARPSEHPWSGGCEIKFSPMLGNFCPDPAAGCLRNRKRPIQGGRLA